MGHPVLITLTLAHIVPVLRPVLCLRQRLGLGPPRDGGVHLVGVDALAQHLVRREERLQPRQLRSFVRGSSWPPMQCSLCVSPIRGGPGLKGDWA